MEIASIYILQVFKLERSDGAFLFLKQFSYWVVLGWAMFTFLNDAMFSTMRCFPILDDAIFRRCSEKKTLTSMFLTMFEKTQNIMLTMHISDVFQTIKK